MFNSVKPILLIVELQSANFMTLLFLGGIIKKLFWKQNFLFTEEKFAPVSKIVMAFLLFASIGKVIELSLVLLKSRVTINSFSFLDLQSSAIRLRGLFISHSSSSSDTLLFTVHTAMRFICTLSLLLLLLFLATRYSLHL